VIRWLDDNPVGQALAVLAGGLAVMMLLLAVVWSLPPNSGPAELSADDPALQVSVPRLPDSPPLEDFAAVTDRPVFNESRRPEMDADAAGEGETADDESDAVIDAPELVLAGVVITPSLKMVTLREKKARESLVAFEGQPLQGDYGSWHVSHIAPREITLSSGDGRELQLQLQVHKAKIVPPLKPEPGEAVAEQSAQNAEVGAEDEGEQPLTRAEEIRQRIAERREELRRAAEAEKAGEQQLSDYQTAVRTMIGVKPKPKENDDDQ
jgi:hypothetical protein